MKRIMFNDVWEDLKCESETSERTFETAEEISKVIVALIEARVDRGMTQRQLAQKCGLKQAAIARMESLKTIPRLDTVIKVAKALKMEVYVDSITAQIDTLLYRGKSETSNGSSTKQLYSMTKNSWKYTPNSLFVQEVS